MKKIFKFYTLFFVLLFTSDVFSQVEPPDGNDPLPAPINNNIIYLTIAGLCYVIYTFKKNKRKV